MSQTAELIDNNIERCASIEVVSTTPQRLIGSIILGLFASALVFGGLWKGIEPVYNPEKTNAWGFFFWDRLWIARLVISLVSLSCGAFIAGVAARKHSGLVGGLVGLPSAVAWGIVAFLTFTNQSNSNELQGFLINGGESRHSAYLGNQILAVVLCVAAVPVGFAVGNYAHFTFNEYGNGFIGKKYRIFGLSVVHLLWMPMVIYGVAMTVSYGAGNAFNNLLESWRTDGMGIRSMIATIFMVAWGWTVHFCLLGLGKCYLLLSGFEAPDNLSRPLTAIKYGCGFPVVAVLAQLLIYIVQLGISKLW